MDAKPFWAMSMFAAGVLLGGLTACDDESLLVVPEELVVSVAITDRFDVPEDTFLVGDEVRLRFEVSNPLDRPVPYRTRNGCDGVEFNVSRVGSTAASWNSLAGFACLDVITDRELAPRETVVFDATWTGTDSAGAPLPPASYEVSVDVNWEFVDGSVAVPVLAPLSVNLL